MALKEISKDIYDVDAWLDEELGKEGTPEREKVLSQFPSSSWRRGARRAGW